MPKSCTSQVSRAGGMFSLGQVFATPGAIQALSETGAGTEVCLSLLRRHSHGDWGDLGEEDKAENDFSVKNRLRILSAYTLPTGVKIWIITEADRSYTTVLLPEEY